MPAHVIVWDLETVPDLKGFAAANDLEGKSDDQIREAMGDKFPKHIYHSIVCIGALSRSSRKRSLDSQRARRPTCRGADREGIDRLVRR